MVNRRRRDTGHPPRLSQLPIGFGQQRPTLQVGIRLTRAGFVVGLIVAATAERLPEARGHPWYLISAALRDPHQGGQSLTKKVREKPASDKIEVMGAVTEALKGTQFVVTLDNDHQVLAYPCGKIRKYYIRLLLGDRVKV